MLRKIIFRLNEDHLNCKKLAETLESQSWATVDLNKVETNIVFAYSDTGKAASINEKLAANRIQAIATVSNEIRFFTSLMISTEEISEICSIQKNL